MLIRIALLLLALSPPHRRFGKSETFRDLVRIRVPVTAADAAARRIILKVTSQGCSDKGVCYVPLEQVVSVRLPHAQ